LATGVIELDEDRHARVVRRFRPTGRRIQVAVVLDDHVARLAQLGAPTITLPVTSSP